MKRFLVFHYVEFYPTGGKGDVEGDFDTVAEAVESMKNRDGHIGYGYFDLLDMEKREWVDWREWMATKGAT